MGSNKLFGEITSTPPSHSLEDSEVTMKNIILAVWPQRLITPNQILFIL